jgi:hypothetical protein
MTFDNWVKTYIGTQTDYDSVSGVQCVDLVKLYLDKVFGIKAGAWGNARDYWLDFDKHPALVKNFKKIKDTPDYIPQKGDIVVWSGEISKRNNYGHIAVAAGEGTKSYFYSYDQNWNGKGMAEIRHNYYAVYGSLRPKNLENVFTPPVVQKGNYRLTNVRGIYNGAGAKTGRKTVGELTADGRKNATSQDSDANAYLRANTAVTILETKHISSGNLWARIPSGWLCIWEHDKNKLFIV